MRTILDDVEKVTIKDNGLYVEREPYSASHHDGEFPDAFRGDIEPPTRKSKMKEILKSIVVVMLAFIIIKTGWAILLHVLPYLSQYISL